MIISKHENDKIFLECDCGCSIISISNIERNRWYLGYYGHCNDKQPDFEMTPDDLEKFVSFLTIATTRPIDKACSILTVEFLGVINSDKYKECLALNYHNDGCISISKYHKHYKKLMRLKNKFSIVPEHKCSSDWSLVVGNNEVGMFKDKIMELKNNV